MKKSQKALAPATKRPKNKMKIAIITAVAFLIVVAVVVGVVIAINTSERSKNEKAVGNCGDFEIPYEELRFVTLLHKKELEAKYGEGIWDNPETAEKYRAELEKNVLSNMNTGYVTLTICKQYGIDPYADDVEEYIDGEIKKLMDEECNGNKGQFKEWLKEQNMTENFLRYTLRTAYLESVIYYTMIESGIIVDYSQKNLDEFKAYVATSEDYLCTLHIYIENEEGEDPNENLKIAEDISEELRSIKDDDLRRERLYELFGSAVNDDTQHTTKDPYYFIKGEMDPVYEAKALELEVGEVSEAFACTDGYYVVMRFAPDKEYIEKNAITLLNEYSVAELGLLIETYRNTYKATLNEYGKSLDLVAMQ